MAAFTFGEALRICAWAEPGNVIVHPGIDTVFAAHSSPGLFVLASFGGCESCGLSAALAMI